MPLVEIFASLGPVGKLVLLSPLALCPVLTWWLLSPANGVRLRVYLASSLAPVLLGGLETIRGIQNIRAVVEAQGPVPAGLLAAAMGEVLFPLLAGLGLSVLFLAVGLVGESMGRAGSSLRLPRPLFVGAFAILLVAMVATRAAASLAAPGGHAVQLSTYFGVVSEAAMWFVLFVLIFRMWQSLDRRFARTTPGRAVGFLFLPVFSIYWLFQVIWGWGRDWNRMNRELGRDDAPLPTKNLAALTFLTLLTTGINSVEPVPATPPLSTYSILLLLASLLTVVLVFGAPVVLAWTVCTAANRAPSTVPVGTDAEAVTAAARMGRPAVPVLATSAVALALVVFLAVAARAGSLQRSAAGTTAVGSRPVSTIRQADAAKAPLPPPPPRADVPELAEGDFLDVEGGVVGGVDGGVVGDGVGGADRGVEGGVVGATRLEGSNASDTPVSLEGGTSAPTLLHEEPPVYPDVALKARVEGTVVLRAIVDRRGSVREVSVLSGHPLLAGAAADAVKKWRYEPPVVDGVTIESIATVTVEFKID